jgi:hypothetical protein
MCHQKLTLEIDCAAHTEAQGKAQVEAFVQQVLAAGHEHVVLSLDVVDDDVPAPAPPS